MKTNNKRHDREAIARCIKGIKAAVGNLEAYFKMTKRQHKRLNLGHDCYDPVESATFNIMVRTAALRSVIEDGPEHWIELDDGTKLRTKGGPGNNRGRVERIPVKYLTAACNNPDSTLTPEEYAIRYMKLGKCGR